MIPSRALDDVADVLFRVLFSLIFVVAGVGHFVRPHELVTRLLEAPLSWLATAVAPASLLILLTGVILVPAGLALLLGFWTRPAAVLLLIVLVPITITVDVGNPKNMGPLFKNIALFGGLIHFAAKGAGGYALDNLLPGKARNQRAHRGGPSEPIVRSQRAFLRVPRRRKPQHDDNTERGAGAFSSRSASPASRLRKVAWDAEEGRAAGGASMTRRPSRPFAAPWSASKRWPAKAGGEREGAGVVGMGFI